MPEPLKPQKPTISSNRKLIELTVDEMSRVSVAFEKSQTFKSNRNAMTAAEIFVVILAGQELGLGPSQAMMGIKMIEGKPEMSANTMAALVKAGGKYDFRVAYGSGENDDELWCEITFYQLVGLGARPVGSEIGRSRFSKADALIAGLWRNNYLKYWRNMLFARALSNGVKWFCADALRVSAYHEGEIEGDTNAPVPEITRPEQAQLSNTTTAAPEPDREPAVVAAGPQEGYDGPDEEIEPEAMEISDGGDWRETQDVGILVQSPPTADLFDPETEPPPPVVAPPTVEHSDNPRTISTAQIRLFHVKRKAAGLEEDEAKAIVEAICGTRHIDRVPYTGRGGVFDDLLRHLEEMAKGAK